MKQAGQIVLTPFPYTDLSGSKLRPVLMLRPVSARFDDWLVCIISSQITQAEPGFDELLGPDDTDFIASGLKLPSVLRLSRLAVLNSALLAGYIGTISDARLHKVRRRIADWIAGSIAA